MYILSNTENQKDATKSQVSKIHQNRISSLVIFSVFVIWRQNIALQLLVIWVNSGFLFFFAAFVMMSPWSVVHVNIFPEFLTFFRSHISPFFVHISSAMMPVSTPMMASKTKYQPRKYHESNCLPKGDLR